MSIKYQFSLSATCRRNQVMIIFIVEASEKRLILLRMRLPVGLYPASRIRGLDGRRAGKQICIFVHCLPLVRKNIKQLG